MDTVHEVLADIQAKIAVPKGRSNDFGGYKYRKAEDIISAARHAAPAGCVIMTSDRIEEIAGQIFVISTASLTYRGQTLATDAGAMQALTRKGMDASQITGSASSYARKYALQGLFALDNGEADPDSYDNRQENGNAIAAEIDRAVSTINAAGDVDSMTAAWRAMPDHVRNDAAVIDAAKTRKAQITKEAA